MALEILKKNTLWISVPLIAGLALLFGACSQATPAASSVQPSADQAKAAEQGKAKDLEIANLKSQLASLQKDTTFWKELTALEQPVPMKSMTDHRAYMTPSGMVLALHFDNMNLDQAQHLNWVAVGLPGKNCKEEQERLEKGYGAGFTHFHDMKNDTHGGAKGADGVWFIHTAVRDFESPMSGGKVKPGVDLKFMPTPVQSCQ